MLLCNALITALQRDNDGSGHQQPLALSVEAGLGRLSLGAPRPASTDEPCSAGAPPSEALNIQPLLSTCNPAVGSTATSPTGRGSVHTTAVQQDQPSAEHAARAPASAAPASAESVAAAFAIATGATERTEALLDFVLKIGANTSMRGGMWDGWTLLHAAAYKVSGLGLAASVLPFPLRLGCPRSPFFPTLLR